MQQKTSFSTILLGLLLVIVVINVIVISTLFKKGTASSYAISFTQPVYSFEGVVKSVGKDSLVVEYTPTTMPTLNTTLKKINIKVFTTNKTSISSGSVMIPYLFKNNLDLDSGRKKSLQDITSGSMVTVTTSKDLRTLDSGEVQASSINVQSLLQVVTGKVVGVEGSNVIVKGTKTMSGAPPATGSSASEARYIAATNSNTEFVKMPGVQTNPQDPEKPIKLQLKDLKVNDTVTVYSYPGQDETTMNALLVRVEQVLLLEAPRVASTSATKIPSITATIAPPNMSL
jgi:hypothetical protein